MGRRGPAPDPSWLQLIKGNPGKRPENKLEPKPKRVAWQEPPEYFDEEHRKVWFSVSRELNEMEILTSADAFPLERYVVFLLRWRACQAVLARAGGKFTYAVRGPGSAEQRNASGVVIVPEIPGPVKFFKPIPEVRILQELSSHLLHIEDRFGLSPSARSRIVSQDPERPSSSGAGEGEGGGDDFSDLDS